MFEGKVRTSVASGPARGRILVLLLAVCGVCLLPPAFTASSSASVKFGYLSRFGTRGSGSGQFSQPVGVAVEPGGDVYVTDRHNYRVEKFDSLGHYLSRFGTKGMGAGRFLAPAGVSVDPFSGMAVDPFSAAPGAASGNDNDVFVTLTQSTASNLGPGVPVKFSASGNVGLVIPTVWSQMCTRSCQRRISSSGKGRFKMVQRVAVDPSNGDVYVTDSGANQVVKFDSSGRYLLRFGSRGSGAGQFNYAFGVAVDPSSGDVYATDLHNDRVEKFDSSGHYLSRFGRRGTGAGQLNVPRGVAVDPSSGDVYVTERNNSRVSEFSSHGRFLGAWGWGVANGARKFEICTRPCRGGIAGAGQGEFGYGRGVGVDGVAVDPSSGDVYVADSRNDRVEKFGTRT